VNPGDKTITFKIESATFPNWNGTEQKRTLTIRGDELQCDVAFKHIFQLGLEGIVSKKLGSRYESGRSSLWLKTINPNAPALA
jgi:hypothetical protein